MESKVNKEKGSNAERELLHLFFRNNWAAARVAGSGSTKEYSCDLIVGRFHRKYAIEVKSCKTKKRYIDRKQIEEFLIFSEIFGLKPVVAIKFSRQGWFFLKPQQLEKTRKGLVISLENAKKHGKTFEKFIK